MILFRGGCGSGCSPQNCVGFLFLDLYPRVDLLLPHFHTSTQLCHIQIVTHNCVTHTQILSHTNCHTTLSHTNCHTQLLRGRRGSWRHLLSFRVAGVALGDMPSFYVAGVVLMGLGCWCLDVFGGPGSGKKMLKFQDAFWRSILDTFWRLFTVFYCYFTMFFVPLA